MVIFLVIKIAVEGDGNGYYSVIVCWRMMTMAETNSCPDPGVVTRELNMLTSPEDE